MEYYLHIDPNKLIDEELVKKFAQIVVIRNKENGVWAHEQWFSYWRHFLRNPNVNTTESSAFLALSGFT